MNWRPTHKYPLNSSLVDQQKFLTSRGLTLLDRKIKASEKKRRKHGDPKSRLLALKNPPFYPYFWWFFDQISVKIDENPPSGLKVELIRYLLKGGVWGVQKIPKRGGQKSILRLLFSVSWKISWGGPIFVKGISRMEPIFKCERDKFEDFLGFLHCFSVRNSYLSVFLDPKSPLISWN